MVLDLQFGADLIRLNMEVYEFLFSHIQRFQVALWMPHSWRFQSRVVWGPGQLDLVCGSTAHSRGLEPSELKAISNPSHSMIVTHPKNLQWKHEYVSNFYEYLEFWFFKKCICTSVNIWKTFLLTQSVESPSFVSKLLGRCKSIVLLHCYSWSPASCKLNCSELSVFNARCNSNAINLLIFVILMLLTT